MGELISVIIPVYNVENYLHKCVESIIHQTYSNLEIILIDDGSTDLSSVICDELASTDERITVIHQKNAGLCSARNAGLDRANGRYIGFIDSDDWAAPDMYEYLYDGIQRHNADIVACRYFRVIPGKETSSRCDGETVCFTADEAIEEIVNRFRLRSVFWNKLFRREIFDSIRFPEGHTFEGTYMMHEVFDQAKQIVMLGDPKYYYFKNKKSIIYGKDMQTDIQQSLSNIKRFHDLVDRFPYLIKKLLRDTLASISGISTHGGKINQSVIDRNLENLKIIRDFLLENDELIIKYYNGVNTGVKELRALLSLTVSSFKKAYRLRKRRILWRKSKKGFRQVVRVLVGINLREKNKPQLLIPPPKELFQSGIKDVPGKENLPVHEKLTGLHACEMEIMHEIGRICRENNITYYMYGGTLLGAVRHKGFIPWDDDVDLVMPRADYDKFAQVCETQLGKEYFYQTCFNDPEYPMLFAKVRRNETRVSEDKWSDRNMHHGCFVDILPLDHFPESRFFANLYLQIANILQQACAYEKCKSSHLLAHIAFKYLKSRGAQYAYRKRDRFLRYVNRHGSLKYYCSFGSHYMPMLRRRLEVSWFGEAIDMEFEGGLFPAPCHWEGYIHHLFGNDYMQLPPVNERVCHTDFNRIVTDQQKYREWEAYRTIAMKNKKK